MARSMSLPTIRRQHKQISELAVWIPLPGTVTPIASGFGNNALSSINLGASGTIYVLQSPSGGTTSATTLFAINPSTGMVSTVFTNTATSGPAPGVNLDT